MSTLLSSVISMARIRVLARDANSPAIFDGTRDPPALCSPSRVFVAHPTNICSSIGENALSLSTTKLSRLAAGIRRPLDSSSAAPIINDLDT